MSGQQPQPNGPRGWNPRAHNPASPSPSSFMYRPPSPWTPVAPSPPPLISGTRRPSMPSPAPMSPTPFAHAMSPGPSNLRGTRGSNNMPHPRPQWPQQSPLAGNLSPAPYQPPMFQPTFFPNQSGGLSQPPTPQLPPKVCPSPTAYAGPNGPRPFRPLQHPQMQHQNSYGGGPSSSFQLSPTPSPIVCQTPSSEFMYGSNRQTPMSHAFETQQYQQQQYPRQQQQQLPASMQQRPQSQQNQYDYVGVPLEPPQPKSYVIYDDEEEYGPSTAEIIANQSQDYVDEKLAEYQMTILQLQGK